MTRLITHRQAQRIEVRRGQVPGDPPISDAPEQFLWRGRLYVVRAVLARWTESGGWWRTAAVRGLTSGDGPAASPTAASSAAPLQTAPIPSSPKWGQRAWGEPAPDVAAAVGPASIDDREREWWRVEADSGRLAALSAGPGVYDLCFDWSEGAWSLARVLD